MLTTQTTSRNCEFTLIKSRLLKFYDTQPAANQEMGSPITAITALIGEDLVLGLLRLYLEESGQALQHEPQYKCTSGQKHGPRLDAWLHTQKGDIFQTEVKNWCASAIGGVSVSDKRESVIKTKGSGRESYTWFEAAKHNRERYLNRKDVAAKVWKVLVPMKPPEQWACKTPAPLLAFWSPVAPTEATSEQDLKPFFSLETKAYEAIIEQSGLQLPTKQFPTVWIFSASNYLRALKTKDTISIHMPRVHSRLRQLLEVGFPIGI